MTCSRVDLTKPVQTLNGRRVHIFTTALKGAYPVGGIVTTGDGDEYPQAWTDAGRCYEGAGVECEDDLVNVPDRPVQHCRTLWVAARGTKVEHHLHISPEEARKAFPGATAIIEVALDWIDGEGIETSL